MTKTIREALLSNTLKRMRVKLPEYGLDLYVQEMNAEQRDQYYNILTNATSEKKQKKNIAAKILLPSLLDLEGNPILTDEDLDKLTEVSPQVIVKLTNSLLLISGLLPGFYEAEKRRLGEARLTSSISAWLKNLVRH
jgi:hypothetical protein